ncbi:MAG TPA: transposase [Vicinamibacterales bacterium]|nr:transposase [Vicinamibacterales bacterium]
MARGNRKGQIFIDDDDRLKFFELLSAVRERYRVRWQSFVVMKTHYHMKVETPEGNISAAMQYLNSKFAEWWNYRRHTTGHVFAGRFKAPLIEDGRYAMTVLSYIATNPVKAEYVKHAREWPWSSHRALAGLERPPEFLEVDWLRRYFDGRTLRDCQRQYQQLVDVEELHTCFLPEQIVFGSDEFRSNVRALIGASMSQIDVPRSFRALARPPLASLLKGLRSDLELRNRQILRAQVVHGYTQSEIARALGVHPNTISKITRAIKHQRYFVARLK